MFANICPLGPNRTQAWLTLRAKFNLQCFSPDFQTMKTVSDKNNLREEFYPAVFRLPLSIKLAFTAENLILSSFTEGLFISVDAGGT